MTGTNTKNAIILLLGISLLLFNTKELKSQNDAKKIKYRRSSLHTILVESEEFPRKETVIKAYNNAPFPDKYNNHSLEARSFNPKDFVITEEDRKAFGKNRRKAGGFLKDAANLAQGKKADEEGRDMPITITKYIRESKLANKLVAKWFDRQPDGSFDMNLIGERGSYNASEMEANIAKGSARGLSSLADAGEELIHNTFVVFSRLTFVSNEIAAAAARDVAKNLAKSYISDTSTLRKTMQMADETYERAKEGYSVWTYSYLYQLKWNDSIAAVFYNDLWIDKSKPDSLKKAAFDKSNIFELEYIGDERAASLVTFSAKETRTEDQLVEIATVRNLDNVLYRLQKKFEVFKTKVPLYTGNPITAKIGMKEGLEGGERFEVLEQTLDPKTGLTTYKQKGKITVDKHLLWDNRFVAGETVKTDSSATVKPVIDRTTFSGGSDYYPGMLIRQLH